MPGTISPVSDIPGCSELASGDTVLPMTDIRIPLDDFPQPRGPGDALKECMKAIRRTHPDYESAQAYAILSLNETLQSIAAQLAELNASIREETASNRCSNRSLTIRAESLRRASESRCFLRHALYSAELASCREISVRRVSGLLVAPISGTPNRRRYAAVSCRRRASILLGSGRLAG